MGLNRGGLPLAKKTVKKKTKAAAKKRTTASAKKKAEAFAPKKSAKRVKATAKKKASSVARKNKPAANARAKASKKKTVTQTRRVAGGNGKGIAATTLDPVVFPEKPRKKVKTYLTAKQLREFKALLEDKRAELFGDVQRLTAEALHQDSQGGGDHSAMPIHMADIGSDNWEQDFTLGLIANEEALVRDIDDALIRIKEKTYGICVATQNPISVARLRAKPWAKHGIEYARMRDEGRLR